MKDKKLNIAEICPFSAGVCGVWTRVIQESIQFKKLGYRVRVFSSNIVKGTKEIAHDKENIGGISIERFKSNQDLIDRLISKNVTYFNFERALLSFSPDIVITHLLHPHSFKALDICRKKNIPCYLVTHAPFNVKRCFPLNLITKAYYSIKVKPKLNKFNKIISIARWEKKYLIRLGVENKKIIYIPNGLPNEFFKQKKSKKRNTKDVLFLGRIAPIKDIETLIASAKILPKVNFSIVGSAEANYLERIKRIIKKENIKNVKILNPVYNIKEKIELIDQHKLFVLPSKREAMPQVLIEAMARGKIVLSSNTDGGKEIITDGKTGFLFKIGDFRQLAELITKNLKNKSVISKNASIKAKDYSWDKLIKEYKILFRK